MIENFLEVTDKKTLELDWQRLKMFFTRNMSNFFDNDTNKPFCTQSS